MPAVPKSLDNAPLDYQEAFERLPERLKEELGSEAWLHGVDWAEIERCAAVLTYDELVKGRDRFLSIDMRIADYYNLHLARRNSAKVHA